MNLDNYIIRSMTFTELNEYPIKWAAEEGWNPGIYDSQSFYAADPNGFLIGLLDDEPISCISVVSYQNNFGFLGFYIVKPDYRGMGYGFQIWNKGIKYLQGHNIGLDGVINQQENYKKSGFKLAYKNLRNQGFSIKSKKNFPHIHIFSDAYFSKLLEYDAKYFPSTRKAFLHNWTNLPDAQSLISLDNGNINGFGTIRKCLEGYKIGPLYAENENIAEELFLSLISFPEEGKKVFLDTPEINKSALLLANKYKMQVVFETARMYTGDFPEIDIANIYGVTTFELG